MTTESMEQPDPKHLGDRRILVVGLNYWPEETGNAPYTTGLAEHLVRRGAAVTVIAGMPYYPQWRVAAGYRGRWRLRETRHGVALHRFRQYVPGNQSALRRALFEATFLAHAATARGLDRPDLVFGVLPSLSDGVLAATLARRHRVPLALLVQDLVGQSAAQSGIAGGGKVVGVTRSVEGWVARQASGIAVVAEGFRPPLMALGVPPERIVRVRNWTHIKPGTAPRDATRARLAFPVDKTVCLHAGNMGLKQGLENLVDCARLALAAAPDLLFVLMGDGNQRAMLEERARDLPNLRFLPPQPEDDFPNVLAAADVLLVNQRPTVTDMSLPGKLTSYFASGRPVVAAVSPTSETARELTQSGAGRVVDAGNPDLLLAAIRGLAADSVAAADLGTRGQAFARGNLTEGAALERLERFVIGFLDSRAEQPAPTVAVA
ncbi:MAG TPA: WcaI family glycosyltransferase [Thermomicrobiales bacterium]